MTTIDNNPPMAVQNVEYQIDNENKLTIEWNEPDDAVSYIIESRDNFSRPWEILENIDYTKNKMVYEISNLSGGFHYYRIISVDRMGYQNADMDGELLEIFIEFENINSATSDGSSSTVINNYIIATSLLVLTAIASAAYAFRSKKEEVAIDVNNSNILVPVELLNEEQINSAEEDKPTFSVVQGSQFSRTTVFVCVGGCQSEFENVNDGDDGNEIMCPHCGLIGDSPL